MYMKTLFLFFLLLCFWKDAEAQLKAELDTISVTATRISTPILESGKFVSVFTEEDISRMPVQSVDDLLRSLPGININGRQGFGMQADVGVRGSTFSQVLFLLDNTPLNDPLTAHFNTNIPVALSEIGQIELIRGPASTSYGADAVGGVVHIKTKSYLRKEIKGPENIMARGSADISFGEHNLQIVDATAGVQQKNWQFSTSVRKAGSDGEEIINPAFSEGCSSSQVYNNYFDMTNLTAAFSANWKNRWSWYIRSGIEERDFSARYFYTRSIYDESTEQINNRWLISTLAHDTGKNRTEINASYRIVEDVFNFNSAISPVNEHETGLLYLNASHQIKTDVEKLQQYLPAIEESQLMLGAQILNKQIESTDRGDHETTSGGIYIIKKLNFSSGLALTSSLRFQFDPVSDLSVLPQFSAAYDAGEFIFRTSVGKAIREGDFTERYISSAIPNLTPGRNLGNPDLLPEKSTTFDVGADWLLSSKLRVTSAVFYRTSSDLIDYALVNSNEIPNASNLQPDAEYFYASNISETDVYGLELNSELVLQAEKSGMLKTEVGYTFIETRSDKNAVSRYIANHPSHQAHLDLSFTGGYFSIHSQSNYYVRSEESNALINAEVPSSYFVSNLKMAVKPFSKDLQFYFQVLNLTDTQYQEILGAPMPGRWLLVGLKYSL